MAFPFACGAAHAYMGLEPSDGSAMNSFVDPLNIVLMIAAVIMFWRLKSVLGARTGLERLPIDFKPPQANAPAKPEADAEMSDVTKPPVWNGLAKEGSELALSLEAITAKYPSFDAAGFMRGAAVAYEMVMEAFAAGNRNELKDLLAPDVLKAFVGIIDERATKGETHAFQLVTVKKSSLENASLSGSKASLGVRFAADVISARKDNDGNLLEGDDKAIREISDFWVFERDMTSRNPNWKLVSTGENG
jgi:predicted lipid-binding transport protein (Tim44 family)